MNIAIIGDGGWGTAIASLLDSYGHRVSVWGPFADYIEEIKSSHANPRYLPDVKLSPSIMWTADEKSIIPDAELIVLAVPSQFYAGVCEKIKLMVDPSAIIVSLTKGFNEADNRRMSEVAGEILKTTQVVALSGPSHAEEVARRIPTAVTAACENHDLAVKVQRIFSGPRFRVYTSADVLGVEIGGAVKNVIAIAVGASDGLGFGDNTRAALITRGLSEIIRLGVAMGAKPETLSGLSGMGDLIVTCTSEHSRNHSVGFRLGRGEQIDAVLNSMKMVAEGVWNAKLVYHLAQKYHVAMPITEVVYKMCYENFAAEDCVMMLMERDTKPEA